MGERLSDGRASDAEFPHQVTFGGKQVAYIIGLVDDAGLEPSRDLLIELLGSNGPVLGWYTYHTTQTRPSIDGVKHAKVESSATKGQTWNCESGQRLACGCGDDDSTVLLAISYKTRERWACQE
jgi:hypothetical protein